MKKRIILVSLCAWMLTLNAFADTVVLKTGQALEGKITDRNNDAIRINYEGVEIGYLLSEIDSINSEKIGVSLTPGAVQAGAEAFLTQPQPVQALDAPVAVEAVPAELVVTDDLLPAKAEPVRAAPLPAFAGMPSATAVPALAAGILLALFIFMIVFYIFGAICLQVIAKKTQTEPYWMAWVPVANLFLMCRIAGLRYWWLLLILASVIPWAGWVTSTVFNGYVWYKIAQVRNKPGWIGVLSILPVVNLVVMGYLAFSE